MKECGKDRGAKERSEGDTVWSVASRFKAGTWLRSYRNNASGLTHTTQQGADRPWAWYERGGGGSDRDTLTIDSAANRICIAKITVTPVNRSHVNQGTGTRISAEENKQFDQQMVGPIGNWTNGGRVTDHWTGTLLYYGTKFNFKDSYPTTAECIVGVLFDNRGLYSNGSKHCMGALQAMRCYVG